MIIAIIILYILGWLSVSCLVFLKEKDEPTIFTNSYVLQNILMTFFFFWWATWIIVLAGYISEMIKDKRHDI